jgi:signal peptidase I
VVIVALALGLALGIQAFVVKPYQIPSESMEPTLDVGQRVLVNRFIYHFTDPDHGDIVVFHPPQGAETSRCLALSPGQVQAMARREVADQSGAGDISQMNRKEREARLRDVQRQAEEIEETSPTRERGQPCTEPTEEESDQNFIKRLIGLPGDEVLIFRTLVGNSCAIVNGEALASVNEDSTADRACAKWREGISSKVRERLPDPITIPADHYFMMGDNRGASDDSRIWGPVPREWIIGKAFATYWPPKRIGIF